MQRRRPRVTILIPAFFGLIIVIALAIYTLISIRTASHTSQEQLVASSRSMLSVSAKFVFEPLLESNLDNLSAILDEFIKEEGIRYAAVRDSTFNILLEARTPGWLPQSEIQKSLASQAFSQQEIYHREHEDNLIMVAPISSGSVQLGTLEIVFDPNQVQKSVQGMTTDLILYGVGVLAVTIIISILLTRSASGQLQKVVAAASEIGQGNLDAEVPNLGVHEIAVVGEALEYTRKEIKKLYQDLEEQVERLKIRTSYSEATAAVARDTISLLGQKELLSRVVTLIDERFDFYRQGIFIIDSTGEWAKLEASSGEGAQSLLKRNFRLKVGQEGIVGHVTATGEPYVSQDISKDPHYFLVEDTGPLRSELALPLISGGAIIGALDIQSREVNAFNHEIISVVQTLADQIAVAISNSRLFEQSQENIKKLQRAYAELSGEAWKEYLQTDFTLGYYSNKDGTTQITKMEYPFTGSTLPELELPVVVRGGQVIGKIMAHKSSQEEDWSPEEITLMQTILDQLSVALEGARLYEDTQRRAARERLVSEITTKIRSTNDPQVMLETAVSELRQALHVNRVQVLMNPQKQTPLPEEDKP